MQQAELETLLGSVLSVPKENEFIEFKDSNHSPEEIGKRLSALANGAALRSQSYGYLVFGIQDETKAVIGTSFDPAKAKVGQTELEFWLSQRLSPKIDFQIYSFDYQGKKIVLFHIPAASGQPVTFTHIGYVRVGSYVQSLKDYPEKEQKLWQRPATEFEQETALERVSPAEVIALLDTQAIFDLLLKQPYPTTQAGVLEKLQTEKLIRRTNGHYAITNLGALLFAKDLTAFDGLVRKVPRVIKYKGISKFQTEKDQAGRLGYASGFGRMLDYITALLPSNEVIEQALRREVRMYPPLALRELIMNALIHQDFRERGTSVLIEIYDDRLEISNPGKPMIAPDRFIDEFQSRNEMLAAAMRRIGFCEEKGSGIDKVIVECELWQLPAPDFQVKETHTKAILYAHMPLEAMSKADKIRACYQHCVLMYVTNRRMTNQSLRERFSIDNQAIVSKIIRDTIAVGQVRQEDPDQKSRKFVSYIPFWA